MLEKLSHWVNNILGPPADFLEGYVWSWPGGYIPGWPVDVALLALVLLSAGFYVTMRLGFVQIRGFKHAIDITRGKYDDPNDDGDLNHFQALTTALSATVGIGNIAGVALAIRWGGPGALFWMWVTAFFGMALKYTECTLAVQYRKINADGSVSGGPMYYMEKGLGWKWMAVIFATFAMLCSLGSGCMNQSNTLTDSVSSSFGVPREFAALVFAAIVAAVIIGGIKRIGRVTSILAPLMASAYVLGALIILLMNIAEVPAAFMTIVTQAFNPEPIVGGAAGSFFLTMMWGVRRGLFSNEAGQGSAPFAHAAAKTDEPVREGLVAALEPFIDTLVICTMTGLVIVSTGAYKDKELTTIPLSSTEIVYTISGDDTQLFQARQARAEYGERSFDVTGGRLVGGSVVARDAFVEEPQFRGPDGLWTGRVDVAPDGTITPVSGDVLEIEGKALLLGAPLTAHGFKKKLGSFGNWIVTFGVILFAVSTGISWSYYGDRATEYLFGAGAVPIYRWVFVFFFFMGGILPLEAVWKFGDVFLGLMSFPNLIAVFLLSGGVARATAAYFSRDHKRRD